MLVMLCQIMLGVRLLHQPAFRQATHYPVIANIGNGFDESVFFSVDDSFFVHRYSLLCYEKQCIIRNKNQSDDIILSFCFAYI